MKSLLDRFSSNSGDRYVDLLNGIRGLLWNAMSQNPEDMRSREYLKRGALDKARDYRATEEVMFEASLEAITAKVEQIFKQDTGVDIRFSEIPFAVEYLFDLRRFFSTELTSQLQRDIAQLERRLADFSVEVFMNSRNSQDPIQAHMNALINTREQMKFYFKDRAGRKHLSQKFVRNTTRHTLLSAAVELYAIAASFVASHMEVTHSEGSSKAAGSLIGFRREQGFPLLAEVRDEIFHPNSDAFLKAVM